MRRKSMKKIHESLEAVYIYIYISQVLIKQIYVNIAKKLCVLDVSKMHGFFELSRYCYINEIMQSVTKKKNNKEEREKAQMKISKKSINLKQKVKKP